MIAVIYTKYGSLIVLQLKEVEKPTPKINTPKQYFGIYTSIPGCRYITCTSSKRNELK